MEILEIQNVSEMRSNFERIPGHVKLLPSIMMLVVAAKLFFFFISNVVYVVVITRAGWSASTYHKYLDQTRRNYESTMSRTNPGFEGSENNLQKQPMGYATSQSPQPSANAPSEVAETRYNDTSRTQQIVYPYAMQPRKEEDFKIQRPAEQRTSPLRNVNNEKDIDQRFSQYPDSNGNGPQTPTDVPEQQRHSNTRVKVLPSVPRSQSELKKRPVPPPKPQNNRYSMQPAPQEAEVNYRNPSRTSSAKVDRSSSQLNAPDELRSQLPWSYFKPRDDVPKKAFNNLEEADELPAVPIPDYTLHFPPKRRVNLSDSDNSDSWTHQRY
jgi:hypothetical protein